MRALLFSAIGGITCIAIGGCGGGSEQNKDSAIDTTNAVDSGSNLERNGQSGDAGQNSPGSEEQQLTRELLAKSAACQRALVSVERHAVDASYCKNNKGIEVCQWLYMGPDNSILFDQREDESCDKSRVNKPLACSEAVARFSAQQ